MGRYFAVILLSVMLLPAPGRCKREAEPAFFSLMFPQLIPEFLLEDSMPMTAGEGAQL